MEVSGGAVDTDGEAPAAVLPREPGDFTSSFARLQGAVRDACRERVEWPEKIAAAIHAAVQFAAANPEATRTLTMESRVARDEGRSYLEMIEYFSELLRLGIPEEVPLAASTEQALVGGIAAVVSDHTRSGRAHRLGDIAPELVYLTLLPYLGFAEAKRWAWPAAAV
jgi:hypothetical protein